MDAIVKNCKTLYLSGMELFYAGSNGLKDAICEIELYKVCKCVCGRAC